jgi:hypothetical protein
VSTVLLLLVAGALAVAVLERSGRKPSGSAAAPTSDADSKAPNEPTSVRVAYVAFVAVAAVTPFVAFLVAIWLPSQRTLSNAFRIMAILFLIQGWAPIALYGWAEENFWRSFERLAFRHSGIRVSLRQTAWLFTACAAFLLFMSEFGFHGA